MLPYEGEEDLTCEYVANEGVSSFPAQENALDECNKKVYDNVFVLLRLLKCIFRTFARNPEPEIPGTIKMTDFSGYYHHLMLCGTNRECRVKYCFPSRLMFSHWTGCWHSQCYLCGPLVQSILNEFMESLEKRRPLTFDDYLGIYKYRADVNLMKLVIWKNV